MQRHERNGDPDDWNRQGQRCCKSQWRRQTDHEAHERQHAEGTVVAEGFDIVSMKRRPAGNGLRFTFRLDAHDTLTENNLLTLAPSARRQRLPSPSADFDALGFFKFGAMVFVNSNPTLRCE